MTTWMVDLNESVGQRVMPDATWEPADRRFRKVSADTLGDALALASCQVLALNKMRRVIAGESAVMSDRELDWLIDWGLHPCDVASAPNPDRLGLLDAYVVAKVDHPLMRQACEKMLRDGALAPCSC